MLIILLNVITTHYVLVISILISVFNIGLSSIHVYNEITPQNFEVFLVAAGAVASTWGCYSSHLSSLHWHPLLKFKPWHHFPPLEASIEMSIDKIVFENSNHNATHQFHKGTISNKYYHYKNPNLQAHDVVNGGDLWD